MKTDIILRMKDGSLHVFQNVLLWSDYKDKHERLEVKYRKSKTPAKFKIKDIYKFILINERCTIVREYKD